MPYNYGGPQTTRDYDTKVLLVLMTSSDEKSLYSRLLGHSLKGVLLLRVGVRFGVRVGVGVRVRVEVTLVSGVGVKVVVTVGSRVGVRV